MKVKTDCSEVGVVHCFIFFIPEVLEKRSRDTERLLFNSIFLLLCV